MEGGAIAGRRLVTFAALTACWLMPVYRDVDAGVSDSCLVCRGLANLTLSERVARADVAVMAKIVLDSAASRQPSRGTRCELVRVARDPTGSLQPGAILELSSSRIEGGGTLLLLLGNSDKSGKVEWSNELSTGITEKAFNYAIGGPPPESPAAARLKYLVEFLESPDETIARDAFAEIIAMSPVEIAKSAELLPREKLRKWFTDRTTSIIRRPGYGMLLGCCGDDSDAALLEKAALDAGFAPVGGGDLVMFGYLMLTGEPGLELLEKTKIVARGATVGETYSAIQAVRHYWWRGNSRINRERLKASLRLVLDNPEWQIMAIVDLARWKDWSIADTLMQKFENAGDDRVLKRNIITFMIAAAKDMPGDMGAEPSEHVVRAGRYLDRMRATDPKLVAEGEKFFYLK